MAQLVLRDFVYLDWERVRSLAAQIFRGVPEGSSTESRREVGLDGQVEGGLVGLLKGRGGLDYRYFRSDNETRSFHHHVYSLIEEKLRAEGLICEIDSSFDFSRWTRDFFKDGQFVLVRGVVRFMDYAWIATMMDTMPKLLKVTQYYELESWKQLRNAQGVSQKQFDQKKQAQQKMQADFEKLKVKDLSEMIRHLYGDVLHLKIVPNMQQPDKLFFGSGSLDNLSETAASLSQKYGYEVDAGWLTLGQVNLSVVPEAPALLPIGNAMEDALEQVACSLFGMMRIASGATFPSASITPISIYRIA